MNHDLILVNFIIVAPIRQIRWSCILRKDTTLRSAMDLVDISYFVSYFLGTTRLDGAIIHPKDLDKTLEQLDVADRCFILYEYPMPEFG